MKSSNLPVSVIIERLPGVNRWQKFRYAVKGVILKTEATGSEENHQHGAASESSPASSENHPATESDSSGLVVNHAGCVQKLFPMNLVLHEDECVSYYQNLIAEKPRLLIVSLPSDDEFGLKPEIITADYDHAHAYLETEGKVDTADIPPNIYLQLEAFVIENYHNEKLVKRKRKKWFKDES